MVEGVVSIRHQGEPEHHDGRRGQPPEGRSRGRRRLSVGDLFHRRPQGPPHLPGLRRRRPGGALHLRGGDLPPVAGPATYPKRAGRAFEGAGLHRQPEAPHQAARAAESAPEEDDADGGPAHRRVGAVRLRPGRGRQQPRGDSAKVLAAHRAAPDAGGGVGADPPRQGAAGAESEAEPRREFPLHDERQETHPRWPPRPSTPRSSCTPTTSSTPRPSRPA